jgi:UDP-2,3-diacylglucosamine pyrophosphatase LpxH
MWSMAAARIDAHERRRSRFNTFRTVFISDVHLGTRGCQAELLLDFIRHMECDTLYLVGDIIDGWKLKGGWYWPQAHNDVVQKILRMARKGVNVIYVPGNHDEMARDYCGVHFGGVVVARDAIHETADGRAILVLHGDEFDGVVQHARWLAFLGDWAYRTVLMLNTVFNLIRRRLGFGYWSLSAYPEGQGEERPAVHRELRSRGRRRSPPARRRRRDLRPHPQGRDARHRRRRPMSTTATGWKAAPPWSSISTAAWKFWNGPSCGPGR